MIFLLPEEAKADTIWYVSKRAVKILVAAGAAPVLLFLGAIVWVVGNNRDIAPVDTSDLVPERIQVPDEENAYTFFVRAFQSFHWPRDDWQVTSMLLGRTWDEAYATGLISQNAATLTFLGQGLGGPAYEPGEPPASEEPVPPYLWSRDVSDLVTLRIMQEHRAGKVDTAWQSSLDFLRFQSLIYSRPRAPIEYTSCMVSLGRGLAAIMGLLQDSNPSEAQLVRLLDRLNHIGSLDQGLIRAMQMHFRFMDQGINMCVAGYAFHPNRTRLSCAEVCRAGIRMASCCYADINVPEVESAPTGGIRKVIYGFTPNCMGRTLVSLLCRSGEVRNCLTFRCRLQSHLDGLRLMVACRLYEMRHGRLPETLDALVPELIDAVPTDPFDGKLFRYAREDAVVYSVSTDLKDSWSSGQRSPDALLSDRTREKIHDLVYYIHPKSQ